MVTGYYLLAIPVAALAALVAFAVARFAARPDPPASCCWHCEARGSKPHARGCPAEARR
jgi:hypothetical protein